MATQANDSGGSVSAARITAYGGVGVAIIGAMAAIINGVVSHPGRTGSPPAATPTTITHPPPIGPTNQGSVDKVEINGSGTEITVTGSAAKDIDSVAVLVG